MNKTQADITVVVPVWNLDSVLGESIKSIRDQKIPVEIIIVNNASSRPVPKFRDVRVVRLRKRVTVGEARNAGLAAARTKYVFFMDGDDKLLPGTLKFLRRRLADRPRAVAASCTNLDWNPVTDERRPSIFPPKYAFRFQYFRRLFALLNLTLYWYPVISVLIDTEAARRAGGFPDSNFRENWIFSMCLCFQGRVIMTHHPGKLYRTDPGRITLTSHEPAKVTSVVREIDRRMAPGGPIPWWARALKPLIRPMQNYYLTTVHKKRWAKRHGRTAA